MWQRDFQGYLRGYLRISPAARLAIVITLGAITSGCWQPLYSGGTPTSEGVQDKFAGVDIPPVVGKQGTPAARLAVSLRNALRFDLHNGGEAVAPIYQLKASVGGYEFTSYTNPNTGRPQSEIEILTVSYQLVELATGKQVLADTAYAHVSFDNAGDQQRFAKQRGQRNAEDLAVEQAAQTIRNRLASYFVAGT
jgi:LPS-assembly lipoprotein